MSIQWKGIMPAVTTKFTDNDELDLSISENVTVKVIRSTVQSLFTKQNIKK